MGRRFRGDFLAKFRGDPQLKCDRMTHADLVDRAERWLRNSQRCGVVLTEFASSTPETPDAIGWQRGALLSILVECKTSRGDFYADGRKPFRRMPHAGIGRLRYYLAPPGVLTPELIRKHRPKWGLLEARPRTIKTALKAEPFALATAWRELPLLYSYARRIHQYGLPLLEAQAAVRDEAERQKDLSK